MEFNYHRKQFEQYAEFGLKKEEQLKPILEEILQQPLTKTQDIFDNEDFYTGDLWVELKSRQPHQLREEYNSWIAPMCKFVGKDKPVVLFYYWDSDRSLYKIEYDPERFSRYNSGLPAGSTQNHYWIPASDFTFVRTIPPEVVQA